MENWAEKIVCLTGAEDVNRHAQAKRKQLNAALEHLRRYQNQSELFGHIVVGFNIRTSRRRDEAVNASSRPKKFKQERSVKEPKAPCSSDRKSVRKF